MKNFEVPSMKPHHKIMIPIPDKRLVFVLTPKVASTSIVHCLLKHYDATIKRPFHGNFVFSWMNLSQVQAYCPGYRRVMFVRNPYDRLVGAYEYHIVRRNLQSSKNMRDQGFHAGMKFGGFLTTVLKNTEADPHYAIQSWQTDRADFIGKFEDLAVEWTRMRDELKLDFPDLPHVNKGKKVEYHGYYNDQLREAVTQAYNVDLQNFGYKFN